MVFDLYIYIHKHHKKRHKHIHIVQYEISIRNASNSKTLLWRHNGHYGVSNHQPRDCLLNRLFRCRSKKTSKLRVTGLCAGNSPGAVNSPNKWTVTRKMFPFMTSSCFMKTPLHITYFAITQTFFNFEYGCIISALCVKFENNWTTETHLMGKRVFARFEFKISFRRISHSTQGQRVLDNCE